MEDPATPVAGDVEVLRGGLEEVHESEELRAVVGLALPRDPAATRQHRGPSANRRGRVLDGDPGPAGPAS
eukprot:9685372-Lingulodinium_polyedra.AAC.1